MNKYDGLYIFVGSVKDEALDKQIEKATAEITRLNGNVIDSTVLVRKTFAHRMKKKDSGVYVKVRFELEPDKVKALIARYHLTGDVFRVQILAVDEKREAILESQAKARKAREEAKAAAEAENAAQTAATSAVQDEPVATEENV